MQTIVIPVNVWNEPAMEIARQYDLPERLVKEALSFYAAHKKVVDALIELGDEAEKSSM